MCYKSGFGPALLVYTPTLPLPLETRGREPSLTRMCSTFALSYLALCRSRESKVTESI